MNLQNFSKYEILTTANNKPVRVIQYYKLSTVKHVEQLNKAKKEILLLRKTVENLNKKIICLKHDNEILRSKLQIDEKPTPTPKYDKVSNINQFVGCFPQIAKEDIEGGFKIYCTICHAENRLGKKDDSLENFIQVKGEDCNLLNNGKSNKWYNLKKKLIIHINNHEITPFRLEAQRNLFMIALTVVKMKGAARHFEQLVSLLKCLNVNVGDYGHSRRIFLNILQKFQNYINHKLSSFLTTPLATTGLPPHFAIALDKGTFNRTTNQATLALINTDRRIAIPVDCSIVYSIDNNELKGGKTVDLVNQCLNSFLVSLNLDKGYLSHITAVYADGQYGKTFHDTFKEKAGFKCSDYFISLWDYVHWIDIEVKRVITTSFLEAFIRRCNTFHNLFGIGKGREEYKLTANILNTKAYETSGFSQTRFSSSYIRVLKSFLKTYPTLVKTFELYKESQSEYNEIKCLLKGADFPMDLCAAIDILSPLAQIMEAAQSITYVPWSFIRAMNLILERLMEMYYELNNIINEFSYQPSLKLFPLLGGRWEELLQKRNESQYFCSWVKVERSTSKDSSGVWKVRDIKDCLMDYSNLCVQLHGKLKERFENNVGKHIAQFGLCFDMNQHLEELVYLIGLPEKEKLEISGKMDKQCIPHFNQIYNYLKGLAHLENHLHSDSWVVFKNWKSCFRDLIFNHSHTFGNWFVDNNGKPLELNDALTSIRKEEATNLFIQTYTLILDDQSHVSGARFSESNMITFLLSDMKYFSSKEYPRELRIVLDYVFSTCGSEACVESFYSVMKTQQQNGAQQHETISLRAIIDWIFPIASKCINTCEELGKIHLFGDKDMLERAHNGCVFLNKSKNGYKLSKVCDKIENEDHKISLILNKKDLKTK